MPNVKLSHPTQNAKATKCRVTFKSVESVPFRAGPRTNIANTWITAAITRNQTERSTRLILASAVESFVHVVLKTTERDLELVPCDQAVSVFDI